MLFAFVLVEQEIHPPAKSPPLRLSLSIPGSPHRQRLLEFPTPASLYRLHEPSGRSQRHAAAREHRKNHHPQQSQPPLSLTIQIDQAFAGYGVSYSKTTAKVLKSVSERIERRNHFGACSNQRGTIVPLADQALRSFAGLDDMAFDEPGLWPCHLDAHSEILPRGLI